MSHREGCLTILFHAAFHVQENHAPRYCAKGPGVLLVVALLSGALRPRQTASTRCAKTGVEVILVGSMHYNPQSQAADTVTRLGQDAGVCVSRIVSQEMGENVEIAAAWVVNGPLPVAK